jgi:hypothetical protein
MGFLGAVKGWTKRALTPPKELRKINVGKTIKKAVIGAVENFESTIRNAGASVGGTVANVNESAVATRNAANVMPYILGGGLLLVAFLLWKRRGR